MHSIIGNNCHYFVVLSAHIENIERIVQRLPKETDSTNIKSIRKYYENFMPIKLAS